MSATYSPFISVGLPRSFDDVGAALATLTVERKMSSLYVWTAASSADGEKCAVAGAGGGAALVTMADTADEVAVAPLLSTAVALNEYVPAVLVLQVTEYGLVVSDAINAVPT